MIDTAVGGCLCMIALVVALAGGAPAQADAGLLGGAVLRAKVIEAPADPYAIGALATDSVPPPFTRQLTARGVTLLAGPRTEELFLALVATTLAEIFTPRDGEDGALQRDVLVALHEYRAALPVVPNERELERLIDGAPAAFDTLRRTHSVCDIIMSRAPEGQVMEVVEHLLHAITDVGLHYRFPDEWGLTRESELGRAMQRAIDAGWYDVRSYEDMRHEPEVRDRVLLQEFAYWFVSTAWDLQVPYGPDENEWTIRTPAELARKLPRFWAVYERSAARVMSAPSAATLERIAGSRPRSGPRERFGVEELPGDDVMVGRMRAGDLRKHGFTKGVAVAASDRGAIWIIAQDGVSDLAVARARNVLRFYLRPLPGEGYGSTASKREVARRMVENRAMLMMPVGRHREGEEPDVPAQSLFEHETPVDGSVWYLENDWEHRDAAFEEIFHLVHDTGIGTDFPGALPAYQKELDREARAAIEDSRWGRGGDEDVQDWLRELEGENSLAQEYIAAVIDTYYGLWGAFDERPGGMWGIYCAKTRDEQARLDAKGQALLRRFLPEFLVGYEALIDPGFEGTFSLRFDPALAYTHKSRYLVEVTLTGSRSSNVVGNDQDNVFRGNRGDNHFDGGAGEDLVCFSGARSEYTITGTPKDLVVRDEVPGRDGSDRLVGIERVRFRDGEARVGDLVR